MSDLSLALPYRLWFILFGRWTTLEYCTKSLSVYLDKQNENHCNRNEMLEWHSQTHSSQLDKKEIHFMPWFQRVVQPGDIHLHYFFFFFVPSSMRCLKNYFDSTSWSWLGLYSRVADSLIVPQGSWQMSSLSKGTTHPAGDSNPRPQIVVTVFESDALTTRLPWPRE